MKKPCRSWRRLALSLIGIAVIAGMWAWATTFLFRLPEHSIASFTSITNNAHYVIGVIVLSLIAGHTASAMKAPADPKTPDA